MAYSRFWDSDIYIYPHISGHIECSTCWLNVGIEDTITNLSVEIKDDITLLSHIAEHRAKGHNIPDDLEQEILSDPDRYTLEIDQDTP
jgi:hypothetical protein